jgi:hypothetical protein
MSPIEHVWDALDRRVQQCVPVPDTIQKLRKAIEEERNNIPQAKINSLINSMQRRCVVLHEANDTDWFSDPHPYFFKGICDQQMHAYLSSLK